MGPFLEIRYSFRSKEVAAEFNEVVVVVEEEEDDDDEKAGCLVLGCIVNAFVFSAKDAAVSASV